MSNPIEKNDPDDLINPDTQPDPKKLSDPENSSMPDSLHDPEALKYPDDSEEPDALHDHITLSDPYALNDTEKPIDYASMNDPDLLGDSDNTSGSGSPNLISYIIGAVVLAVGLGLLFFGNFGEKDEQPATHFRRRYFYNYTSNQRLRGKQTTAVVSEQLNWYK